MSKKDDERSFEEGKTEAEHPYGSEDDGIASSYDGHNDTNAPRRTSTRNVKPVQPFTPSTPEDAAVKAALLKHAAPSPSSSASSSTPASSVEDVVDDDNDDKLKKGASKASTIGGAAPMEESDGESGESDNDVDMDTSLVHFPRRVWEGVNELDRSNSEVVRWTADGRAFTVDMHHRSLSKILRRYFKYNCYKSFHRQLNAHGWTKPREGEFAGSFYHPLFSRNMNEDLFETIRRSSSVQAQLKHSKKIKPKSAREKGEGACKEKTILTVEPSTIEKRAANEKKAATSKKKSFTGAATKKRMAPSAPTPGPTKKQKAGTKTGTKKSSNKKDDEPKPLSERLRAEDRLKKYKKLKQRYNRWTVWNIPPDLKALLEPLEVDMKRSEGYVEDDNESDVDISGLLCDEKMPEWVENHRDSLTQLEFEDLVVHDQSQHEAKAASQYRVPPLAFAKGRALPSSKFSSPTEKWLKVKIGGRVDIYWEGDDTYYSAVVIKQQEGTSYFYLMYEEDGQSEWLDLSREDFSILDNENPPIEVVLRRPGAFLGVPVDQTPRKDNRSATQREDEQASTGIQGPENSHLIPLLRYSWKGMGLGRLIGTPAFNDDTKRLGGSVTPLDVLQDVRSLGLQGLPAPSEVTHLLDHENGDSPSKDSPLISILRQIKDEVSKKDKSEETGRLSAVRRVTDHWSKSALLENMRRVENQVSRLSDHEERVLQKLKMASLM